MAKNNKTKNEAKKQAAKEMKGKKKKLASTQANLPIAEIKDGVVVLKNGAMRKMFLVSSVNFALKSEDEQQAMISGYVGFLNSLDFPLQVVVQSRKLMIKPYLTKLSDLEEQQQNELLRVQIADYRSFIKELVDIGQIMTKRFYVVVPYDPSASKKKKGFFSQFADVITPSKTISLKEKRFLKQKKELDTRARKIHSGLEGMGLQVAELDTQSLIEVFYSTYNPEISYSESLGDIDEIRVETDV